MEQIQSNNPKHRYCIIIDKNSTSQSVLQKPQKRVKIFEYCRQDDWPPMIRPELDKTIQ